MNDKFFVKVDDRPYEESHALAPIFIDAAWEAHEAGAPRIPGQRARELMAAFGLSESETAAHVYLAGASVSEQLAALEVDTTLGMRTEE